MRFRFSGHETFSCRYSWLPKAYRALKQNARLFSDEDEALTELGVGKNMMRSIRFWVQIAGVATSDQNSQSLHITKFGDAIFKLGGLDPYLEDKRTLWLLHWNLCVQKEEPMFAWYFLFNQWSEPEFSRSQVTKVFQEEAEKQERKLSVVTLEQHFDIFFHTYFPTRSIKGDVLEDNLDSPFTELNLISNIGERLVDSSGRREFIYTFRSGKKADISTKLISYCLYKYWEYFKSSESTLSFRDVSVSHNSIGQIFKLSELDLYERMETLKSDSLGIFEFHFSAALPRIVRTSDFNDATELSLLQNAYKS